MARTRIHGQQVTDGSIELVDLSSALASTISGKADAGNLAPVATSGSYNDLTNLPTLFSGAYADLTGKPTLFSGSYTDLTNKPTLFSGSYTDLTNKPTLASFTTLTSPASGQYLKFNGSAWVNSAIAAADLPVAQSSAGILDTGFQIILGEKRFGSTIQASSMTSSGTTLSLSGGLAGTFPGGKIVFTGGNTTGSMDFYTKVNGQQFQEQIRANISDLGLFSMYYGASIQSGAAATKGLIVKGAASQSANLFEAQNSAGTVLSSIDSGGTFSGTSLSILHTYLSPTTTGVNLNGVTSNNYIVGAGNARTLMVKTSGANPAIETTDGTNSLFASSIYGASVANVSGMSWAVGLVVNNSSSASTNIMKLQSVGVDKFVVDKTGTITTGIVPVARVTGLHAVATSGSYNDLSDKPSIPSIAGLATESYVDTKVADLVASAPAVLDTLNELAAALGDDPNFATTMTTALASKADTSSLAAVATSGSYVDLSNKPTIYTPVKEVFTALVDGTETEFVLADAPAVAGTEQVFVNGILQSAGASDDYTISGDTITFNTAPEAGWKLIVYYFV